MGKGAGRCGRGRVAKAKLTSHTCPAKTIAEWPGWWVGWSSGFSFGKKGFYPRWNPSRSPDWWAIFVVAAAQSPAPSFWVPMLCPVMGQDPREECWGVKSGPGSQVMLVQLMQLLLNSRKGGKTHTHTHKKSPWKWRKKSICVASSQTEGKGGRVFAAQKFCLGLLLQFQAKKSRLSHTVHHQA